MHISLKTRLHIQSSNICINKPFFMLSKQSNNETLSKNKQSKHTGRLLDLKYRCLHKKVDLTFDRKGVSKLHTFDKNCL